MYTKGIDPQDTLLEVELITLTIEERTEKEEKYMNFFILYFFFLVRNDDYGCSTYYTMHVPFEFSHLFHNFKKLFILTIYAYFYTSSVRNRHCSEILIVDFSAYLFWPKPMITQEFWNYFTLVKANLHVD